MKKIYAVALAVGLLGATAAIGQENAARVQIPFEFRAGGQVLPAGEYQVNAALAHSRFEFRQVGGGAAAYIPTRVATGKPAGETGVLVFHQYGKTFFLNSFVAAGRADRYVLPPTAAEREMAKKNAHIEVATLLTR